MFVRCKRPTTTSFDNNKLLLVTPGLRDVPHWQRVPMATAILMKQEWLLHMFLLILRLEAVATPVDDQPLAVATNNGYRCCKNGTVFSARVPFLWKNGFT